MGFSEKNLMPCCKFILVVSTFKSCSITIMLFHATFVYYSMLKVWSMFIHLLN
jgi:hypothetical protein